jgi:hypothetical protein
LSGAIGKSAVRKQPMASRFGYGQINGQINDPNSAAGNATTLSSSAA